MFSFNAKAAVEDSGFYLALVRFIENLYAGIQTPNNGHSICFYGTDDVSSYIQALSIKHVIDLNNSPNNYKSCRIIYISKNNEKNVREIIKKFNQSGVATIGMFDSFIENGGIIFIGYGRRDFELIINFKELKASNIKIDSTVSDLVMNN